MEPAGGPRPSSSSGPSAAGGAGLGTEQLNELTQASPPGTRTATQCRMICSLLQGHAFFKQIPEASVLALAQHITLRNFREHQVVFRQGSSGQAFYIILQGRCAEFRTGYANSPTPTYESMVGNNRTCNLEEYELQGEHGGFLTALLAEDTFGAQKELKSHHTRASTIVATSADGADIVIVHAKAFYEHVMPHGKGPSLFAWKRCRDILHCEPKFRTQIEVSLVAEFARDSVTFFSQLSARCRKYSLKPCLR